MADTSKEKRLEGSRLIEEKIKGELLKVGKDAECIQWNLARNGKLLDFHTHVIHITVDKKVWTLTNVPDQRVVDYADKIGTEVIDANIRAMAKSL